MSYIAELVKEAMANSDSRALGDYAEMIIKDDNCEKKEFMVGLAAMSRYAQLLKYNNLAVAYGRILSYMAGGDASKEDAEFACTVLRKTGKILGQKTIERYQNFENE